MPIPKPYKKRAELYRKRKRNANSTSDDDDAINDELLEEIDRSVKSTDKKVEAPVQNSIIKDTLNTPNDNKKYQSPKQNVTFNHTCDEENTNIKHSKKDIKAKNDSQNSLISVRKLEDLCKTPKKNIESDNLNAGSVKKENVNTPDVFSPLFSGISMMEWNSQTIKSLLETPISSKKERYSLNTTPNRRKKRKSSLDVSDYDQLSDTFKSDLNNVLPDMEAIDMLHDLTSVMDFEDIKVPADIFTSTVNNSINNEDNVEMSKDPLVDPLFIENQEECKAILEDVDYQNKNSARRTRSASKASMSFNAEQNRECTQESKAKDKDTYLKDILGELDIDLESETESDEIPKETIKKLYNLKVQLVHVVPKQHKIEQRAASRGITKSERQQFLKYGPLKKGVFTPSEDDTILNNWKKFCKVHSWNPKHVKPFICLINKKSFYMKTKEQRINFLQFLANGLPWRPLFSVYNRFKYLHDNHDKSFKRYSVVEDGKIMSYMKGKGRKNRRNTGFCDLAKELGRSHHSIWLRYQLLKKMHRSNESELLKEVDWTLPLIAKFIGCFMDVTLCDELIDLKYATIPKVIWQKLEEKLNIEQNVLKMYWIHQLHMQLFCPEPIYLNDIKIKLIEYMYVKGIAHTREIIWPDVAKHFDGITTIFLCRTFHYLVAEAGIKLATNNFNKIIDYLHAKRIVEIKNELTDKFLPRLSYNNGEVKVVDMDLSEY